MRPSRSAVARSATPRNYTYQVACPRGVKACAIYSTGFTTWVAPKCVFSVDALTGLARCDCDVATGAPEDCSTELTPTSLVASYAGDLAVLPDPRRAAYMLYALAALVGLVAAM